MAVDIATHNVPWTQHGEGYDPATGNAPAPTVTNVDALIYGERSRQDDAGTQVSEVAVLVIAGDLPNPVEKGDSFEYKGDSWTVGLGARVGGVSGAGIEIDPTQSFYECKAHRWARLEKS